MEVGLKHRFGGSAAHPLDRNTTVPPIWRVIHLQCRRPRFGPWDGKIPWRRIWQPTPVFLPRESHGQKNLVGYSPWCRRVGHDCGTNPWSPRVPCVPLRQKKKKSPWHLFLQAHLVRSPFSKPEGHVHGFIYFPLEGRCIYTGDGKCKNIRPWMPTIVHAQEKLIHCFSL